MANNFLPLVAASFVNDADVAADVGSITISDVPVEGTAVAVIVVVAVEKSKMSI